MLRPADTPEGTACGFVKNLELSASIVTDDDTTPIARLCRDLGIEDVKRLSGNEIHSRGAFSHLAGLADSWRAHPGYTCLLGT